MTESDALTERDVLVWLGQLHENGMIRLRGNTAELTEMGQPWAKRMVVYHFDGLTSVGAPLIATLRALLDGPATEDALIARALSLSEEP